MIKRVQQAGCGFSYYTRENRFVKNLQGGVPILSARPGRPGPGALVRYTRYREKIVSGNKYG
ncbi:MAG: hypothetical protein R2861_03735 [Desulfobacterales bacterium]